MLLCTYGQSTTTTSHHTQAFPLLLCNFSRVDGQRAAHGALLHGPRRSPPPHSWTVEEDGGEARGRERDLRLRGMRLAPLSEVAGPQVVAATGGYVAARAPLLVVASLAGGDEVDATTTKYLDDKLDAEFDALMAVGPERSPAPRDPAGAAVCWFRSSRCVPFCRCQALLPGIMTGMNQKDTYGIMVRMRRTVTWCTPVVVQRLIPMV